MRALDVGCGCGDTVLALAEAVGPGGRVTGVDISAPMLAVAGRRIAERGLAQAAVLEADAAHHPFAPGSVDLAFSRFGVMFFDAPAEAFINIRRALAPGGRLFFACWRPFKGNPWFHAPYQAACPTCPSRRSRTPRRPAPSPSPSPTGCAAAGRRGLLGGRGRALRRHADLRAERRDRGGAGVPVAGRPRGAGAGDRDRGAAGRGARRRAGAAAGRGRAGGREARRAVLVRVGCGLTPPGGARRLRTSRPRA